MGHRSAIDSISRSGFQSTHPVWGGTLGALGNAIVCCISIHPPRVGWDSAWQICCCSQSWKFQSTHPVWGGTPLPESFRRQTCDFNPPTPCGVGLSPGRNCPGHFYFNPPTPCGVGHKPDTRPFAKTSFQSTHPVWGGTGGAAGTLRAGGISIHPPRAGWDPCIGHVLQRRVDFNPPTPCGVGLICKSDPPKPV